MSAASPAPLSVAPPLAVDTPQPQPSSPSPYLVSLPVDFLLVGGASIVFFLLSPFFYDGPLTPRLMGWTLFFTWIGNWPHNAATIQRLYTTKNVMQRYPFTAVVVPLLVLVGTVAALRAPAAVAPYFVKITLSWILYHYAGQSIGVSLLYARRAQYRVSPAESFFLQGFFYGTFVCRALWSETASTALSYFGVTYPRFGVPVAFTYVAAAWTYACAAGLAFCIWRQCRREHRAPPAMYLVVAVTHYVWFFVAGQHPAWIELVPFFHGLQYLLIAWAMQLKETVDRSHTTPTRAFVTWNAVRWYALNLAGGAAAFWLVPRIVMAATGIDRGLTMAVVFCAFQVHHSFVDGIIWKLRSRTVSQPLQVNVPSLLRAA